GDRRWRKSSQRLRDGQRPADDFAFSAMDGRRVVGTWEIVCGTGPTALLLGPVAVAKDCRNRGIGSALVRHALAAARRRGYRAGVLVGDAPYYNRFGFSAEMTPAFRMARPVPRHPLLALALL